MMYDECAHGGQSILACARVCTSIRPCVSDWSSKLNVRLRSRQRVGWFCSSGDAHRECVAAGTRSRDRTRTIMVDNLHVFPEKKHKIPFLPHGCLTVTQQYHLTPLAGPLPPAVQLFCQVKLQAWTPVIVSMVASVRVSGSQYHYIYVSLDVISADVNMSLDKSRDQYTQGKVLVVTIIYFAQRCFK